MKQLKISIAAIALITGLASSSATKATGPFDVTYWTIYHSFFDINGAYARCPGGNILCANQYTMGGTPTGRIFRKIFGR